MSTEVRVYLDPSVISALFDSRAVDRQRMTAALWETLGDYRVYISEIVLDELGAAPEGLRSKYLEAVKGFSVLRVTEEAEQLAGDYIANGIFPEKYRSDALHVALASVNGIGYLLSWNFKHLVKVKTRRLVAVVNMVREYQPIEIIAPPEL